MTINQKLLSNFRKELFIRGFSGRTINSYAYHVGRFLDWVNKDARSVKESDVKNYLGCLRRKGNAHATINLAKNAVLSFFRDYLKRRFLGVKSLKKQEKHTKIFSRDIIVEVINKTTNLKHRLLLELLYGSGLRISEAVKMLAEDLDVDEETAIVRLGKGQRDRVVKLSKKFIEDYKAYTNKYSVKKYLFKGRKSHITIRTGQQIIKRLFKKHAKKHAHPHMMRASFATHLFEKGVDKSFIQLFTGHKNEKSLNPYLIYAKQKRVNVKLPIDWEV